MTTLSRSAAASRGGAQARGASSLRVGAAKVDVTPSAGELPKNSQGILDRLYARAIVLESGASSAALITVDAGGVPDADLAGGDAAGGEGAGDSGGQRPADGDSHAQRRRAARP